MSDCTILAIAIIIAAIILSDSGGPGPRGGYGVYQPKVPPPPPNDAPPAPLKTR